MYRLHCSRHILSVLLLFALVQMTPAQTDDSLPKGRLRNGNETLKAFAGLAKATRYSVVKINVNGETVALGAVIDANGLAITKASELREGKLTCWIAGGREVDCDLLVTDEDRDVALVKAHADDLKPISWALAPVTVGQWAVTTGIEAEPHAVGIVSSPVRRILHPRAYIGIQFDLNAETPTVGEIMAGLGAEDAGLKPGDVILAVDGAAVTNRMQLVEVLREYHQGQQPKLKLRRGQEEMELGVLMKVPTPDQLGGSYFPGRMSRINGDVSSRAEGYESVIQHDTVLQPWLCGGPLVNLDGKGIGLNIARAGRVATYALPAPVVKRLIDDLLARLPTTVKDDRQNRGT